MPGKRVYELARELKMDTNSLLAKLEELKISAKSHASTLSEEQIKIVREAVMSSEREEVVEKRIKDGIIRRRVRKVEPVKEEAVKEKPVKEEAELQPVKELEKPVAPIEKPPVEPATPPEAKKAPVPIEKQEVVSAPAEEKAPKRPPKRKKPKKPVEAVIVHRPSAPSPEQPAKVIEPRPEVPKPSQLTAKVEEVKQVSPVAETPQAQVSTPTKPKAPYKKPSLVKEKITPMVHVVEPAEEKEEVILEEGIVEEKEKEKRKKKAKKKGAKEILELPEPKKPIKKPIGRKKEIITKRDLYEGVERMYRPTPKKKKAVQKKVMKKPVITTPKAQKRIIKISDTIQVGELAHRMGVKSAELIKKLIDLGIMANINQFLDFEEASLVAADYGFEVENVALEEEVLLKEEEGRPEDMVKRPPVVTVMGHVDHGKTTLLDTIRRTNVVAGEKGGITQHIGAYTVELEQGKITFIDTPGHEAFTAMRARGAQVTDIVVLVVAADDGVMDRTREAISHAKAAKVPIIVAVNKIDKPEANPDRVKRQMAELGFVPEEWGGDTLFVNISAKKEIGIKELLEAILLQAEMLELKANPKVPARGVVLEASIDRGRGPVATVLVQQGTLKPHDIIVAGRQWGRIRAMLDEKGNPVREASPSYAVQLLGLAGVPQAGDDFLVVKDEKIAKQIIERREEKAKEAEIAKSPAKITIEDFYQKLQGEETKEVHLIVKGDVQGSIEAITESVKQLSTDKCKVDIVHTGVGQITENDIMLASASEAMVIGFNVKIDGGAKKLAEQEKVEIRIYGVIYELIEDLKRIMLGKLEPTYVEKVVGHAEVRAIFPLAKVGNVAGCYVTDGKVMRSGKARVMRNGREVWSGNIENLKRFKDEVREVVQANECGIKLEGFNDFQEGDIIEVFVLEEVAPTL